MTHLVCKLCFSLLLISVQSLDAQPFIRQNSPFLVYMSDSLTLQQAALGGLNTPRPQFVDIDLDGDFDLFVQDVFNKLMYFENTADASRLELTWRSDKYQNLDIAAWYRFVNLDADAQPELAVSNGAAMRIFDSSGGQYLVKADTLLSETGELIVADQLSVPSFADIDCDGDADLFLGTQNGALTFYENTGIGSDGLPIYRFISNRYQNILIVGGTVNNARSLARQRHGANTLTFTDIDADADLDMFWGDFFSTGLYYFENIGACDDTFLDSVTATWPEPGQISSSGFNMPEFADLDADGDQDLLVGVLGSGKEEDLAANLWLYENRGDASAPSMHIVTRNLMSALDIGENAALALGDLDNDGDADLLLGNELDPGGKRIATLWYFENTGSNTSPEYSLVTADYLPDLTGFNFTPVLADLDGDSDLDLLIGEWNGRINYFQNQGNPAQPDFVLSSENFAGTDIGSNAAPALHDIDGDGDLDLFVGEFGGSVNFFENTGSASAAAWQLQDENWFTPPAGIFSKPVFADTDGDAKQELWLGTDSDTLFAYALSGQQVIESPVRTLVTGRLSAPNFYDLDGDGDVDLLAGTAGGGLRYFENTRKTTGLAGESFPGSARELTLLLAPNPVLETMQIQISQPVVTLCIFDIKGRQIASIETAPEQQQYQWSSQTAAGLYFVVATTFSGERVVEKFVKI